VTLPQQVQNSIISFGLAAAPTSKELQSVRQQHEEDYGAVIRQLGIIHARLDAVSAPGQNQGAAAEPEGPETDSTRTIENVYESAQQSPTGFAPLALQDQPGEEVGEQTCQPAANNSELSITPSICKLETAGDLTGCSGAESCEYSAETKIDGEVAVKPSGELAKPADLQAGDLPSPENSACGGVIACQEAQDEPLKPTCSMGAPEAAWPELSSACASTKELVFEPPSPQQGLPVSAAAIEAADAVLQPVGAANEEEDTADLPLQESSAANRVPVEQHLGEAPLKSETAAKNNNNWAAPKFKSKKKQKQKARQGRY